MAGFRGLFPRVHGLGGCGSICICWVTPYPLPLCGGHTTRHSGAWTPRTLRVAIVGPHTHSVVTLSHLWGQQRVPCVGLPKICGTTMGDVGVEGTTSTCWLCWPGHPAVVTQRAQGLWRCPLMPAGREAIFVQCNCFCVFWVVFNWVTSE